MNSKKTLKKNRNSFKKKSKKSKKLNSNIKYRKLNKQYTKKKIYVGRGGGMKNFRIKSLGLRTAGRYITRKARSIVTNSTGVENIALKDIDKTIELMKNVETIKSKDGFPHKLPHRDVRNIDNLNKAIDHWRKQSKKLGDQRKAERNLALLQENKAKVVGYIVKTTKKKIKKKIDRLIKMGPEKMFTSGQLRVSYSGTLIKYIKDKKNLNFDTIMEDPTLKKIYTSFLDLEQFKKFYAKDTRLNTKDLDITIKGTNGEENNEKISFDPLNGRYEAPDNVSIEDIRNSEFSESIKIELIQAKNESFHNFLITKNTDKSKEMANELLTKINEDASKSNLNLENMFDISKTKLGNNETKKNEFYNEFNSRAFKGLVTGDQVTRPVNADYQRRKSRGENYAEINDNKKKRQSNKQAPPLPPRRYRTAASNPKYIKVTSSSSSERESAYDNADTLYATIEGQSE